MPLEYFMRDIDSTTLCTSEITLAISCLGTPLAPPTGSATVYIVGEHNKTTPTPQPYPCS